MLKHNITTSKMLKMTIFNFFLEIFELFKSSLRDAQRQLQDLNYARTRLNDVLLERNQVVDFMAEHVNNGRKPTKVQRRQIDTR